MSLTSEESLYTFLQLETNEYNTPGGIDPVNDPDFLAYLASFPQVLPTFDLPLLPPEPKKGPGVSKIGHCEHPKHAVYRQENYAFTLSESESSALKTVPRRGRPPKGSKIKEKHDYRLVALTVRPLPKRLEAVVGKRQIRVCLTCLKKSDADPEYLSSKNYIGPQPVLKRRKNQ